MPLPKTRLGELRRLAPNPLHRWGIRPLPIRGQDNLGDGRLVSIPGGRVYVETLGSGPPIVALPGFAGTSRTWRPMAEALEDAYSIHLVDFLGYGLSDKPADADHSPVGQARQIEAVMHALNLQRCALLSSSAGAQPAIHALFRQPRRWNANVMVAPFVAPAPMAALGARLAALPVAKYAMRASFGLRVFMLISNRLGRHDWRHVNEELVDEQYLSFGTEGYWDSLARTAKRLRPRALAGIMQMIATPTLVIWAGSDRAVNRIRSERLLSSIPGVTFQVVPRCGHVIQEERPAEAAALIRNFLDSLNLAGGADSSAETGQPPVVAPT